MTTRLTPQERAIRAMTEAELAANIVDTCKTFGLLRYHTWSSRHSPEGFPDECLVGSKVLFRELKRHGKNPTPDQTKWLDRLTAAGQDADVWRPEDWFSGRIVAEIRAAR